MSDGSLEAMKSFYTSRAGWYSLRFPGNWEIEEDEDCMTFYDPQDGVGALQVSAYSAPLPEDPKAVLLEYLSDKRIPIKKRKIAVQQVESKIISSYDFTNEKGFEKIWFISQGLYVLFVTYLCGTENIGKETDLIEEIVDSITINADN